MTLLPGDIIMACMNIHLLDLLHAHTPPGPGEDCPCWKPDKTWQPYTGVLRSLDPVPDNSLGGHFLDQLKFAKMMSVVRNGTLKLMAPHLGFLGCVYVGYFYPATLFTISVANLGVTGVTP